MVSFAEEDDFGGFEEIRLPESSHRHNLLPEKVDVDYVGNDRGTFGEILGILNCKSSNKGNLGQEGKGKVMLLSHHQRSHHHSWQNLMIFNSFVEYVSTCPTVKGVFSKLRNDLSTTVTNFE